MVKIDNQVPAGSLGIGRVSFQVKPGNGHVNYQGEIVAAASPCY